nr:reverse transcriptase domain-containing protein [Tanacetum cinerariifolium]
MLLKWIFELEEHDIHYIPKTSVKGQILAEFLTERPKDDTLDTPIEDPKELPGPWVLFTGGSSCINSSGAGLIITNPKVMKFAYALRTNGSKKPLGNVDSKLMANQVNGVYIAKEPDMIKNLEKVKNLAGTFKEFSIKQVPRGENKKADAISKIASTSFAHLSKQVLVEELQEKSIDEKEILAVVEEEGHTWMILIYEYLTEEILPKEKRKARVICRKAGRYAVLNGILYKKSFLEPWLRCVGLLQANYILREIHEGPYNMHARPRSVVAKVLRSGYYWSTMHSDARNLIKEYSSCQGIDIVGPFPKGPEKVKFLIVAMDYFTKWIEAKPVATITGAQ